MGDLNLAAIEQAITDNKFQLVTGSKSTAQLRIIETPEGKIMHKRYAPRPVYSAEAIAKYAKFQEMVHSMAGPRYIHKVSLEEEVAKEVKTLRLWNESLIPSPKILHYDGALTIIMECLEGRPAKDYLIESDNHRMFDKVLNLYHQIRDEAYARNDKDFLHSDPYPDNFFFDTNKNEMVALDPSKFVSPEMTVKEADTAMNLLFLPKLFLLPIPAERTKKYVEQFVDRFTNQERMHLAEANFDAVEQREYFATQGLKPGNILDIYFRTDVRDVIQAALTK